MLYHYYKLSVRIDIRRSLFLEGSGNNIFDEVREFENPNFLEDRGCHFVEGR